MSGKRQPSQFTPGVSRIPQAVSMNTPRRIMPPTASGSMSSMRKPGGFSQIPSSPWFPSNNNNHADDRRLITLNDAYDMLESYINETQINFDLYEFSQRPTFSMFILLIKYLRLSIDLDKSNAVVPSKPDELSIYLNRWFTKMGAETLHRFHRQDLRDGAPLSAVMKPLALFVRDRLFPIFRLLPHEEPLEFTTKSDDSDDQFLNQVDWVDQWQRYLTEVPSIFDNKLNLYRRLAKSGFNYRQLSALIQQRFMLAHQTVDRQIAEIEKKIKERETSIRKATDYVENAPDWVTSPDNFDQKLNELKKKITETKQIYQKLTKEYKRKRLSVHTRPALDKLLIERRMVAEMGQRVPLEEYLRALDEMITRLHAIDEDPDMEKVDLAQENWTELECQRLQAMPLINRMKQEITQSISARLSGTFASNNRIRQAVQEQLEKNRIAKEELEKKIAERKCHLGLTRCDS